MSKVERLVGALRDGAELDSAGSFSLDRDKARQKLREFRLPDPHRYVLLLVQLASLRGATEVRVDVDADDVRVAFDGTPVTRRDLEELYGAMFIDGRSHELLARRCLAVALDTAKSLATQFVVFESGQPSGEGVRFTLTDDGERVEDLDAAAAGTRIHVRDRWSSAMVEEYFKARRGLTAEAVALRRACALAEMAVFLNGERVSGGLGLAEASGRVVSFDSPRVRGLVGFGAEFRAAELIFVSHGVTIERKSPPELPWGLLAVVDGSSLRTDLSLTRVLQDETYDEMLAAVVEHADAALASATAGGTGLPAWQRRSIRDRLATYVNERGADRLAQVLRGGEVVDARDEHVAQLAGRPAWPALGGEVSARAVFEADAQTGYVEREPDEDVRPKGFGPVLVANSDDAREQVQLVFGELGRDISGPYARAIAAELNRRAWRARPHAATLGARPTLGRARLQGALAADAGHDGTLAVKGEVAATAIVNRPALLVVVEGCLLVELRGHESRVPGFLGVVEAAVGVNRSFDGVRHDQRLASAVLACVPAYRRAWQIAIETILQRQGGVPAASERPRLLAAIDALARPDFPARMLEGFGFEPRLAATYAQGYDWKPLDLCGADAEATTVRGLRPFAVLHGPRPTLAELVDPGAPSGERRWRFIHRTQAVVETPWPVLLLDDPEHRAWLESRVSDPLVDWNEAYQLELRKTAFERQPLETVSLGSVASTASFSMSAKVAGLAGMVGVASTRRAAARMLVSDAPGAPGRYLGELTDLADQPLVACVSGPLVVPNKEMDALAPRAREPFDSALARLWGAMVRELVAGRDGISPALIQHAELVEVVLTWLRLAFPAPVVWRAFRAEAAQAGAAHASHALRGWHRAHDGRDRRVTAAATQALARLDPAVAAGLDEPAEQPQRDGIWRELRWQAAELSAELAAAPVFETWDGQRVSLLAVDAAAEVLGAVPVTATGMTACRLPLALIADGDVTLDTLRAVFGDTLVDAERLDREYRRKSRFDAAPERPHEPYEAHEVLARSRVDVEGLEGELAIPRRPCPGPGQAEISITCDDRRLAALSVDCPLAVVGRLERSSLESDLEDDPTGGPARLGVSDRAAVRKLVRRRVTSLVNSLSSRYIHLDEEERALAATWLLAYLANKISGTDGVRDNIKGKLVRRIYAMDLVPHVEGGYVSVERLSEDGRDDHGAVCVRAERWTAAQRTDRPVALISDALTRAHLERIFESQANYDGVWAAVQLAIARRRQAPALATHPPNEAVASVKIRRSGLRGYVWIDPRVTGRAGTNEVDVGEDGRVVQRLPSDATPLLGVRGAVWGPSIQVDEDFTAAEVPERQLRILTDAAVECWQQLGERYAEFRGAPREFGGFLPLHRMFKSLLEQRGRGEELPSPRQRVHDALTRLPLIEVGAGELVSLEWTQREQPYELAHLGLWEPPIFDDDDAVGGPSDDELGEALLAQAIGALMGIKVEDAQPERPAERVLEEEQPIELPEAIAPLVTRAGDDRRAWDVLLERLRGELRIVRAEHEHLLSDAALECIDVEFGDAPTSDAVVIVEAAAVRIRAEHPVARYALEHHTSDPTALSLLTSTVYTALRQRHGSGLTLGSAFDFHGLHAYLVLTRQSSSA